MSLVSQGRGVSSGALECLGVVGSRCLGSTGPALRVSDPFPIAAPSLFCSAPSSQLQPHFHPGAGPFGRGVRFGGEGGHRDRASFPGVLQSSFCDPQGHRWVASGDRSLMPQRLGGRLPFPYGDCSDRVPVSPGRGLDGIPGSPRCLPPGSGSSIFSPVPEVLRGGLGLPVYLPLLRSLDGPPSVHPRHGSCILDHASSRFPHSPVPRRLVSPGFDLPGHRASEGLSRLAMSSPRNHGQSFEKLFGPESDSGLSRDDDNNFSFEGFPNPQTGAEVVAPPSGVSLRPPPSCVGMASFPGSHVFHVSHSPRCSSPYEVTPASPQCLRSSCAIRGSCLLGRWLSAGSTVVVRRIPSSGRPSTRRGPPQPLPLLRCLGRGLGRGSRGPPSLRLVVSPLFDLFYQPSRASCTSLCSSGLSPFSLRSCSRSVFGQLHRFSLPQETRGHSFVHLECSRSGASPAL